MLPAPLKNSKIVTSVKLGKTSEDTEWAGKKWTIQRNWQHWVHMTQDEEKHITLHKQLEEKKNRTFFYAEIVITINIQYTCKWV
jgi:hypothetical protein